jgi:hypothetical protein
MQLKPLPLAIALGLLWTGAAFGQSLSPMHNSGSTPSDVKGFRLTVGNPYRQAMTFLVIPMDTKFRIAAADAAINFPEITMGPGTTRQVIVTFKIDAARKERTIGVCVQPKDLPGTVLPRVCGTYTGKLLRAGG